MLRTSRTLFLAVVVVLTACAVDDDTLDLGDLGGGKADFVGIYDVPIFLDAREERVVEFRATGGFRVSLSQQHRPSSERAVLRLSVVDDEGTVLAEDQSSVTDPEHEARPDREGEVGYRLTITNRSTTKALDGRLTIAPLPGNTNPEGLHYRAYDVLFTNPVCRQYDYAQPIATADGQGVLAGKPKNVYCGYSDYDASGARPTSPQHRLVEWIQPLQAGDELFLAYLSYSNRTVATELCEAAQRGVKVTFVLNGPTDRSRELEECGGTVLIRGNEGGIGYAHNKIFMVNPNGGGDYMKLAFSSGNMSSGAVAHHENWHFIEVARASYFAEAHRCLMEAQLDEVASSSKSNYRAFIKDCRGRIPYPEETDIHAFFIPVNEDGQAATDALVAGIESAQSISIGAHRFSYPRMIDALEDRLAADSDVRVRLVADDDLYWLRPYGGGAGTQVGDNMEFEADNVERLFSAGGDGARFNVKYMETNHGSHLLHHNKFLLFEGMPDAPDGVLCGAANLTGTGFWTNFENIYYIEIPTVVDGFRTQYARFWDGQAAPGDDQEPPRATAPQDMPERNELP